MFSITDTVLRRNNIPPTQDTYTVQDEHDSTVHYTGVTYDTAYDIATAMHGHYRITNERTGTSSLIIYS